MPSRRRRDAIGYAAMKRLVLILAFIALAFGSTAVAVRPGQAPATKVAPAAPPQELARWLQQARRVTIVRDDWGIPHVYGQTDADAVFGVMYAQAEDDFN